jgi:hypothetical protein
MYDTLEDCGKPHYFIFCVKYCGFFIIAIVPLYLEKVAEKRFQGDGGSSSASANKLHATS